MASQTMSRPSLREHPTANVIEAAYVGETTCAQCHPEQATRHAESGHAHTLLVENLCGRFADNLKDSIPDQEREGAFRFECRGDQLFAVFTGEAGAVELPMQFALGSGKHATTFLTLLESDDGAPLSVEHRISLFHGGTAAGLTPSHTGLPVVGPHDPLGRVKRGRDVTACIGCHSTTGQVRGRQVDDLRANVGCESCHGPGRRHVAAVESGRTEYQIAFAKGRASAEEEVHLCGRCHRSPEALTVLPDPDDPKLARFQPVGLSQSACFRRSEGALKCSTCHDPHAAVGQDDRIYAVRCVACHSAQGRNQKICRVEPTGECIGCHMPLVEVHPGVHFHDHWIRRRGE